MPPPELREYHDATLRVWRTMAHMIDQYPADALIRDSELFAMMPTIMELSDQVDQVILNLPDDTFDVIVATRC